MKIGEARKTYSAPLREFWEEKKSLAKQKKALDEKIKATPSGKEAFAKEAVTLDLSYRAVSEKYEEYSKTMEQIMAQHTALFNAEVSKQQGEAMEEYSEDMILEIMNQNHPNSSIPGVERGIGDIWNALTESEKRLCIRYPFDALRVNEAKNIEVARRIMKGAKVPASDEKKLMEYSMELYMAAKNMAVLNENKKKEEYDSLWDDEKKEENPDPDEVANDAEYGGGTPEIMEVSDVVASATEGIEG